MPRGSYVVIALCVTAALLVLALTVWIDLPHL
jgi:hypothetical protein